MKKPLLICLGVTLLCGMSSFKTPKGVKSQPSIVNDTLVTFGEDVSQQSFQIATIVYDSIITTDGEESQCIKETSGERTQEPCTCILTVSKWGETHWNLRIIYQSCGNNIDVYAKYSYTLTYPDGRRELLHGEKGPLGPGHNDVKSGDYRESICEPYSIKAWACFDNTNQN